MHELTLCQNMLKVIEEQAATQRFRRVKTVWLEVGTLAGVEMAALRFGFDVVMKGSVAEGARLEIIELQALGWCECCKKSVVLTRRFDGCPDCATVPLPVTTGDGLMIKELEVV